MASNTDFHRVPLTTSFHETAATKYPDGSGRRWIFAITISVAYFLAAELGHLLSFPSQTATFWMPAGVALAAFYLTPVRYWWDLALATLFANIASDVFFHDKRLGTSLCFWFANICEAILAAGLMIWIKRDRRGVFSPTAILLFLSLPCLLSTAVGASIGATVVAHTFDADWETAWIKWWSGDVVGMAVTFPLARLLILIARDDRLDLLTGRLGFLRDWNATLNFAASFIVGLAVADYVFGWQTQRLAYITYPVLVWVTLSSGTMGASLSLYALAIVTVYHTANGDGLFGSIEEINDRAVVLQIYLMTSATLFLTLAAVVEQRSDAESALRVQSAELEFIFDATPLALIYTDTERRIARVNPAFTEVFGYQPEQVLGRTTELLYANKQGFAKAGKDHYSQNSSAGLDPHQIRYRRVSGELFIGRTIGAQVKDPQGSHVGNVGLIQDITESIEAERALRRARKDLNLLRTIDGSWIWDANAGKVDFASSFWKLLDRELTRVHDRNDADMESFKQLLHPDDRAEFKQVLEETLRDGDVFSFSSRMGCEGGEFRWFQIRGSLEREPDGRVTRIAGYIRDDHDRHTAEDLLRASNSDLEQFAYIASHDLKEPLRAIGGFSQILESRYASALDDRGNGYLQRVVEGVARMGNLIENLLEFSQIRRDRSEFTHVDLNKCVGEAIEALEQRVKEVDARVSVDELPTIHGNARLLTQLFQNLIANAIKFRRQDVTPDIRLTSRTFATRVEIELSDNGIGIAPQYRQRVFEMFRRLHGRDEFEGTGIGLAICRKIVERHGGQISVVTKSVGSESDDELRPAAAADRPLQSGPRGDLGLDREAGASHPIPSVDDGRSDHAGRRSGPQETAGTDGRGTTFRLSFPNAAPTAEE
ncbi:MAG: MASE1 domain-containing protein [Planctomycetota bacterium]